MTKDMTYRITDPFTPVFPMHTVGIALWRFYLIERVWNDLSRFDMVFRLARALDVTHIVERKELCQVAHPPSVVR